MRKGHTRSAVLLSSNGRTFVGCDVQFENKELSGVSAERTAFLSALADGINTFEVSLVTFEAGCF